MKGYSTHVYDATRKPVSPRNLAPAGSIGTSPHVESKEWGDDDESTQARSRSSRVSGGKSSFSFRDRLSFSKDTSDGMTDEARRSMEAAAQKRRSQANFRLGVPAENRFKKRATFTARDETVDITGTVQPLREAMSIKNNPRAGVAASRVLSYSQGDITAKSGGGAKSQSTGRMSGRSGMRQGPGMVQRVSSGRNLNNARESSRPKMPVPERGSELSESDFSEEISSDEDKVEATFEQEVRNYYGEPQTINNRKTHSHKGFKKKKLRAQRAATLLPISDNHGEEGPMKSSILERIVLSNSFDGLMGIIVALNALVMGIEYQLDASSLAANFIVFHTLDFCFILIFTIELALRTHVLGYRTIIGTPVLALDAVIVVVGILIDVVFPLVAGTFIQPFATGQEAPDGAGDNAALVKLLKTLRALRAIRVLRMLTMFQDLWYVVQMFFFSLRPLLWTVLFILIIIFLFAMFSIVLIGRDDSLYNENDPNGDPNLKRVKKSFSTTIEAITTLFQVMTLDEWANITNPLFEARPWTYIWFLVYISIAALALMNMVTASVLESARTRTKESEFETEVDLRMMEVEELFQFTSGYGVLKKQDFIEHWDEIRPIRELFDRMGLDDGDAESFYDLIDLDHSGFLDHGEMAQSFLELKQVLQDPNRVSLFRGAQSQKERLSHVARALEASQYVRFVREVRKEIKKIQLRLEKFHEELATGIIKTLALEVVPDIIVSEIRAATRNEIQKNLAIV